MGRESVQKPSRNIGFLNYIKKTVKPKSFTIMDFHLKILNLKIRVSVQTKRIVYNLREIADKKVARVHCSEICTQHSF